MGKQWPYIKKDLNGTTAPQSKPEPTVLGTPNLYRKINKIPFDKFEDCYVDNDLSSLIISGTPTQQELQECWDVMHEDYIYAIGDSEQKLYLRLYKEVSELTTRIHLIRRIIEVLYNYRVKKMEDILNKELKSSFKFDSSKPEEYDKLLQKAYSKSKSLIIQYDLKNIQLKAIEKGQEKNGGQKPTREYFSGIINVMRIVHKCPIDKKVITAFEYIDLVRLTNKMNSK